MRGQVADGLDRDVGGQQPEADRYRLLRPPLSGSGHHLRPSEPPDHDHAGQCLDAAAQRPAHQRDRPRSEPRDQANGAFGGHPGQRRPGQPADVTGVAQPPLIAVSCRGGCAVFTTGIQCRDRQPRTCPARWPVRHSHRPMVINWTHPAWCRVTGCDLVSSPCGGSGAVAAGAGNAGRMFLPLPESRLAAEPGCTRASYRSPCVTRAPSTTADRGTSNRSTACRARPASQQVRTGAPLGTRTPNPRIKSHHAPG